MRNLLRLRTLFEILPLYTWKVWENHSSGRYALKEYILPLAWPNLCSFCHCPFSDWNDREQHILYMHSWAFWNLLLSFCTDAIRICQLQCLVTFWVLYNLSVWHICYWPCVGEKSFQNVTKCVYKISYKNLSIILSMKSTWSWTRIILWTLLQTEIINNLFTNRHLRETSSKNCLIVFFQFCINRQFCEILQKFSKLSRIYTRKIKKDWRKLPNLFCPKNEKLCWQRKHWQAPIVS